MRTLLGDITLLMLAGLLWACGGDRAMQQTLDSAEALMEEHPDSAFDLLQPYDSIKTGSEEQRARFAVLYSMALDKNYKDTANFNVLQPALDYYPTHGTNADKIRTLYYEGRIYQNAGRMDEAMQAWAEGLQYRGTETDSLVLAHLLVAQGNEYYRLYQFDKFVENNRQAEEIYRAIGRKSSADKAFLYQFELSLNRDSAFTNRNISRVDQLALDSLSPNAELARSKALQYEMHFGTPESLDARIKRYSGHTLDNLNLAKALIQLGKIGEADSLFSLTKKGDAPEIKYLLVKTSLEKAKENYKEALASCEDLLHVFDREQSSVIIGDGQFAEERSQWRSAVEKHKKAESNATAFGIIIFFVLTITVGFFIHRSQIRRKNEEQRIAGIVAERTAEMTKKIAVLENEKTSLSELLAKASEPSELPEAIRKRLTQLDSLIRNALINSVGKAQEPSALLSNILTDTNAFLENSGKTLEALYRKITAELMEKGLTYKELGFISLYQMGLRGKDIGILLKRTDTYKISCAIRKKLGLDSANGKIDYIIRDLFPSPDNK